MRMVPEADCCGLYWGTSCALTDVPIITKPIRTRRTTPASAVARARLRPSAADIRPRAPLPAALPGSECNAGIRRASDRPVCPSRGLGKPSLLVSADSSTASHFPWWARSKDLRQWQPRPPPLPPDWHTATWTKQFRRGLEPAPPGFLGRRPRYFHRLAAHR